MAEVAAGTETSAKRLPLLDAGSELRFDIYPSKDAYLALKEQLKEFGSDVLRWDSRRASKGPYIDLSAPGADKVDLKALEAFRTPEAKAAFEATMAPGTGQRDREAAEVREAAMGVKQAG